MRHRPPPRRELLAQLPANLLVPKTSIREIEAGWGSSTSTLRLTLDDGQEREWKYGTWYAPPFDEVEVAIWHLRGHVGNAGLRE